MDQEKIRKIIDLQETIMAIIPENFDTSFNHIVDLLSETPDLNFQINLKQAIDFRPRPIDVYARVYGGLVRSEKLKFFTSERFKKEIFSTTFFSLNSTFGSFLYQCIQLGFLDPAEFVQLIRKFKHDHSEYIFEILMMFCWFCEYIEQYDPELYDEILVVFKKKSQMPNLILSLKSFILNFDQLRANNWELKKRQATGFGPEPYREVINKDDVERLKEMAQTPGFDMNARLKPSVFIRSKSLQMYPTLIQFAAFVRSVNCFKFLLENGSSTSICSYANRTLAQFAVAGGCMEIIQILDKNGIDFTGCAQIAAEFHQNEAFVWLYENKFSDLSQIQEYIGSSIHQSAKSNNLRILIFCIEHGVDPNLRNSEKYTPLHYAADYGSLDVLSYLLSLPCVDVNARDSVVYLLFLEFTPLF
ncbi:ankyrin repeat protein [Histomonas meleagridis]|uniref:ankyrin repeat protein n=1 Tax=Histomonas meleagridis TaxID=135588 RepID=UPI003559BDAE|nr:ankyrin repeat protein [Histomonas meleagridis]KAH0801831.1 ankyrin repeat protein [Histomonas meleagridis]